METTYIYQELTQEEQFLYNQLREQSELSLVPNLSLQFLIKRGFKTKEEILGLLIKALRVYITHICYKI